MDAAETIRAYYDSVRAGEPLGPYFADDPSTTKFGISESLRGPDAVVEALADQTATTTDWVIESRELTVGERETFAWFTDDVFMAWTDTERRIRYEFDTRWSGTLELGADGPEFVVMHVSTPGET